MQKLQAAGKLINEALPSIPMGTEFHTKALKLATDLNKLMMDIPQNPGMQATALTNQARQTSQAAPQEALNRMYPQPPAGGPPPPPAA